MTICVECKWHRAIDASIDVGVSFVSHACESPDVTALPTRDAVTGHAFSLPRLCEDVNKGDCPHWEAKP